MERDGYGDSKIWDGEQVRKERAVEGLIPRCETGEHLHPDRMRDRFKGNKEVGRERYLYEYCTLILKIALLDLLPASDILPLFPTPQTNDTNPHRLDRLLFLPVHAKIYTMEATPSRGETRCLVPSDAGLPLERTYRLMYRIVLGTVPRGRTHTLICSIRVATYSFLEH